LSGDFGLLHAVDERLAAYGFETNTGVRFVVVVDMRGRSVGAGGIVGGAGTGGAGTGTGLGLREGEMKVVSFAMLSRRSFTSETWENWEKVRRLANGVDWEIGLQSYASGIRTVTAESVLRSG